MKKIIRFLPLLILILSCKTISINAWKEYMVSCDAYAIRNIEIGVNGIYPGISADSVSVMHITIAATSSKYKIDGPDYCLLSVVDDKNDTIGRIAINCLPIPGKPRVYSAYSDFIWKSKPDLNTIHISLPPYCDNMKLK